MRGEPLPVRVVVVERALSISVAVVALLGLAVELAAHAPVPLVGDDLVAFFSLSYEVNLPTWFSSMLLAGCAGTLALLAFDAAARRDRWRRHWAALTVIFAAMSLDEVAGLHERLGNLVTLDGPLYFSWVIPAAVAVLAVGAAYLRFVLALPPPARRRIVVAGVIYVGGALVMELPLGWWTSRHGDAGLGYALVNFVEETMEMVGAALFLRALLRLVAARSARVEVVE